MVYLGLPINSMVIFHSELLNNQSIDEQPLRTTVLFCVFLLYVELLIVAVAVLFGEFLDWCIHDLWNLL